MLSHLLIKNYALIEHLEMDPDSALNIITGETGAGKSIMLGAIGLLMGNRADSKALYNPTDKCVIEGFFDVSGYVIENLFEEEDLDYDTTCVVRREISPSGKSRAFVNDTPVTLDILRRVTSQLMDIHSQHDSILLGSNDYQLQIVDTYAQNDALLRQYRTDYRTFRFKQEAYEQLLNETATMKKEFDYNHFLYEELQKLELQTDEQEQLEQELTILENAEDIKERLQLSFDYLDNAEQSVVVYLKNVVNNLNYVTRLADRFSQIRDRAQSSLIELRDLANEISAEQENIETNDTRAETIRERLNLIYNLQTKHAVKTVAELLAIQAELEKKVSKILNSDAELAEAKAENEAAEKQLMISAQALTVSRQAVIPQIEKQVDNSLVDLGMPNASLKINVETGKPTHNGVDTVSFLFSANKGVKPQQLKNVASGGEFSRLMMTIKYILASKRSLPTIIFDEIDTGVSGEIAIKMGNMMREMALSHQIIAITHLHQIAAQGKAHYYVYKDNSGNKTVSRVKKLGFNERVQEIAQMIGGNNPSASVLKNAKELLSQKA
ncbi:DNA repair protein RecN [Larkinella terrae]|uniref:DNA repair protein RecN n=1 Tax=Larkinella terrae TaxID=2025311 RepID=A0A7K0EK07_9BACT|nr:DNA repair protein RecN [Larkinella terrae]MRS62062.1 DNA repair protein RecN [Larkinella terrae]